MRLRALALLLCALALHAGETFEKRIWRGRHALDSRPATPELLVCWNIERGLQLDKIIAWLREQPPAILLLQEVDLDARRSGRVDVSDQIARALRTNHVFAAEFQELAQGSSGAPAYQGQAILTSLPLREARVLRFRRQSSFWLPRWYLPNSGPFQRRLGGRMALVAELTLSGKPLVLYNTHLESRGPEALRVAQVREMIGDARQYPPSATVVIAGDLNVKGVNSPVLRVLEETGFARVAGGEISTTRGAPLDYIYARGPIVFTAPQVHADVRAADHFPVTARIKVE